MIKRVLITATFALCVASAMAVENNDEMTEAIRQGIERGFANGFQENFDQAKKGDAKSQADCAVRASLPAGHLQAIHRS